MDSMDLDQARARIRERSELNAFISVSDERGGGDVVAVKDLIDVKGMVTTAGAVILPNVPAADDAPVIKRLRRAGCAIVGKANLHEFAYGVTSINPHYGTVRNPHDPARVAGGSSGGSAVAAVAGGIPEVELGDRERFFQAGLTILLFEAAAYHRRWADECPEKYGADVLGLIRRGFAITQADFEAAMRERARLQDAAERALDAIDALILPATAIVAPPEATADEVREPLSRSTRPFNTTHQPVAVVPAPVSGLPVGIQVAGRTNAETLRPAGWVEREWRRRAG